MDEIREGCYFQELQKDRNIVSNTSLISEKKSEILSFAGKWMKLENIILSEVSQVQKAKSHMFSLICGM
jgi:hypothetical protein